MNELVAVIREKDNHISAIQEKLGSLGGSYFPRKHRDTLEPFNFDKWREEMRRKAEDEGESCWGVFSRWGGFGVNEERDWEAVVSGLRGWSGEDGDKVLILYFTLTIGWEEGTG